MIYGTAEHAAHVTDGRHPGVRDGLQWLTFAHLPIALQGYSAPFYEAAVTVIDLIKTDGPELTRTINSLIAAKDDAVRAGIRHDTGRAGSVPRPQAVTEPPTFDDLPGDSARTTTYTQIGDDPNRVRKDIWSPGDPNRGDVHY